MLVYIENRVFYYRFSISVAEFFRLPSIWKILLIAPPAMAPVPQLTTPSLMNLIRFMSGSCFRASHMEMIHLLAMSSASTRLFFFVPRPDIMTNTMHITVANAYWWVRIIVFWFIHVTEVCFWGSSWQYANISAGDDMDPSRQMMWMRCNKKHHRYLFRTMVLLWDESSVCIVVVRLCSMFASLWLVSAKHILCSVQT